MDRVLVKGGLIQSIHSSIISELEELWPIGQCTLCGYKLSKPEIDFEGNCPQCSRRPRQRSLPMLMKVISSLINPNLDGELLAFAMTKIEAEQIATKFNSIKSVSLYGNYGQNHIEGVDVRNLSRFEENSFSTSFSVLLFDYFVEHEVALEELFRVLRTGGIIFTHIASGRLLDDDTPAYEHKLIHAKEGSFEYLGENNIQSIKVGKDWLLGTMEDCGFESSILEILDPMSKKYITWFIGKK